MRRARCRRRCCSASSNLPAEPAPGFFIPAALRACRQAYSRATGGGSRRREAGTGSLGVGARTGSADAVPARWRPECGPGPARRGAGFRPRQAAATLRGHRGTISGKPMARILIVDDSPSQLLGIQRIVEKLGHETLTAEDGAAGVELARSALPDLILMDVVMPNLNGFQATRTLSRDPATRDIPVVLVTTKDQETDRTWGLRQ